MTNTCQSADDETRWPNSRILFLLAGMVTLTSAPLAATVSDWFLLLTAAVGINQLMLVATGTCPASMLIGLVRARRSSQATLAC
ncbi:MAG: hypothetical protein NVS3B26_25710 [Mycobacteriales bacterium]